MIDYFALALGHGLLAIALLRLVFRDDLDVDPAIAAEQEAESQARRDALAARKSKARASGTLEDEETHGRPGSISASADKNA